MTNVLRQLTRWRLVERAIRLVWGAGRLLAVLGVVLAAACFADWAVDRYAGSETVRKLRHSSWIFAPEAAPSAQERWFSEHLRLKHGFQMPPDPIIDETPWWFRVAMTAGQVFLALGLAYVLLVRPWRRTPPVDELAGAAEKAIPGFDHRLVTAVQLNRPTARTQGMSKTLIAEVTREAGEMAERHNLLRLVDYNRVALAAAVLVPVVLGWAAFALFKPQLTGVLLRRQALANVEIPRTIHLQNVTQEVWPTGAEVQVRYRVTGEYDAATTGRLRVEPEGQPEEYYDLVHEKDADGGAYFVARLPASSIDFRFHARLGNGRARTPGFVRFEAPPQVNEVEATQWLPDFLGKRPDGRPYERSNDGSKRGEVVDALPMSRVVIDAKFSKPAASAKLTVIERGEGVREKELTSADPVDTSADRRSATWVFATSPRTIAYRIDLIDDRGFVSPTPARRGVRMLEDRPPVVTFLPESTRHPDPADYDAQGDPRIYEWGDKLPLAEGIRLMVIYNARSEQGVSRANIAYRIIPRGIAPDAYPKELQDIQHPKDDPENRVFKRLPLKPVTADLTKVGRFVPDLGLFEKSWYGLDGLKRAERWKVNVEFYSFPSPAPATEPAGLEAGGRYMFEIDGLMKTLPDGTTTKLEIGDTVQLFVEAYDKNPTPGRPPGYTREARRKIVVSPDEAALALRMRDEQNKRLQEKLRQLAADQANVFKEPKKEPKKEK
jgi:hypothetical protein